MITNLSKRLLPYRDGTAPVNHCLTSFKNVILPESALLGPLLHPNESNLKASLFRVTVGTLALSLQPAALMHHYAVLGIRYSQRRIIKLSTSIFSFRTQQIPILSALAQAHVMTAFESYCTELFRNSSEDIRIRHAVATIFKVASLKLSQSANLAISERCGAQGLASYNRMTNLFESIRGISIAEGDSLVLCLRLGSDIILGKYKAPLALMPNSLLARHEISLLSEAQDRARHSISTKEFEDEVFPLCLPLVEAIGWRMAYEASVYQMVHSALIEMFVCSVVKL